MRERTREDVGSGLRRSLWRAWYQFNARRLAQPDWAFMNYGYATSVGAPALALEEADEPDRLCIQLYERVARPVDLRGRDVLEVGSGRGGGSSYVMRCLGPATVVGADFSSEAVSFCTRHRVVPGLRFTEGDAEELPFPDASFDAVLNIESSHCYGAMAVFLSEVRRVLRPGGSFLFADFRPADRLDDLRAQLAACGMRLVEEEVITPNVVAALEQDSTRKLGLIRRYVPRLLHRPFRRFAGTEGSKIHERFKSGQAEYLRCVLRKDA
jgi:ubiquinone/menaquinone biosynthesis C-methylase UbiE